MPKWVNKHGSQLSVDEMKGKDAEIHMEGFDFNDIWVKDDKSYPQLKSNKRPKL